MPINNEVEMLLINAGVILTDEQVAFEVNAIQNAILSIPEVARAIADPNIHITFEDVLNFTEIQTLLFRIPVFVNFLLHINIDIMTFLTNVDNNYTFDEISDVSNLDDAVILNIIDDYNNIYQGENNYTHQEILALLNPNNSELVILNLMHDYNNLNNPYIDNINIINNIDNINIINNIDNINIINIIDNGPVIEPAIVLPVNDGQNTHLASIHRSASDSAIRLNRSYGTQIQGNDLEIVLGEILTWAQSLPPEQGSVYDCLLRLTAIDYTHEDPTSGISISQLLALAWIGLADDDKREGSLTDSLALFSEGLYEIQNGYGPNSPICTAGTFNKIIEKLVGIHSDVEQLVITQEQATAKLPSLVKKHAYAYLLTLADPDKSSGVELFTDLISVIKEEGVSAIWDKIEDSVSEELFDEFGLIYNDIDDDRFQGLLESHIYVDLDKLDQFQKKLSESQGYHSYMTLQSKNTFFPYSDKTSTDPYGPGAIVPYTKKD